MIPEDMREIFEEFLIEAKEHLENLENTLLQLEKDPENQELINSAFRSMHTLKGGAGFLGLTAIVEVAHKAEDLLGKIKEGKIRFTSDIGDILLKAVDSLKNALYGYETEGFANVDEEIIKELESVLGGKKEETNKENKEITLETLLDKYGLSHLKGKPIEEILEELVLLPPHKRPQEIIDFIDRLLNPEETTPPPQIIQKIEEEAAQKMLELVEEEIVEKDLSENGNNKEEKPVETTQKQAVETTQKQAEKPATKKQVEEEEKVLRIDIKKIEDLMNLVGELVLDRNRLLRAVNELVAKYQDKVVEDIEVATSSIDRVVGDLQLAVMKTRMQPVKRLFQKFSRVVRDLSKIVGKEVELIIQGEDTEMDKSILEKLEEPLVHIIRNSLDHGIEPPEERKRLGKPPVGKIILRAYYQGDRVYIEIEDDGRGIDPDKVARKAIEKGLITKDQLEKMTEKEIVSLIFTPGFSTAEQVSQISGRGVGMDVVMTTVLNFRGTIDIWSEKGRGTKISIAFPLTVGIIRSLIVSISGKKFAIPIFLVNEIVSADNAEIKHLSGRNVLLLREKTLPLLDLSEILKLQKSNVGYVIVCILGNQRIAFTVEDLFGDEEIVIKPLGKIFGDIKGISGATITGDGKVVLILDIVELIKSRNIIKI